MALHGSSQGDAGVGKGFVGGFLALGPSLNKPYSLSPKPCPSFCTRNRGRCGVDPAPLCIPRRQGSRVSGSEVWAWDLGFRV